MLEVGALGRQRFEAGWYLYVASALRTLAARLDRHKRLRKRMHWHVDYLRRAAAEVVALPIRSARRDECDVASALSHLYGGSSVGFGAFDCTCDAHLFHAKVNPLHDTEFIDPLHRFRMRVPE